MHAEADKIAEYLLKIKAVRLNPREPFTWSSGWKSPIYCDNRLALSFPEIRTAIRDAFAEKIRRDLSSVYGIVGVATGAIAWGALVADKLGIPFAYVRSSAKGHGLQNLIEGQVEAGKSYVIIEDLISTGKSSALAVESVQATGAEVMGTLAIFSYGFPQATETFRRTGTTYHSLTNLSVLLRKATQIAYIHGEDQETILAWQQQPEIWGN
jgi:orotate phosphoribosyltransferase